MTVLFELLAVAFAVLCGVGVGMYAFSNGGFWLGVVGFLVDAGTFVLSVEGLGRLSFSFHKRRKRKEVRCGVCHESDYDWVGSDADHDPIAKCKCGERFVLKKGEWLKIRTKKNK